MWFCVDKTNKRVLKFLEINLLSRITFSMRSMRIMEVWYTVHRPHSISFAWFVVCSKHCQHIRKFRSKYSPLAQLWYYLVGNDQEKFRPTRTTTWSYPEWNLNESNKNGGARKSARSKLQLYFAKTGHMHGIDSKTPRILCVSDEGSNLPQQNYFHFMRWK